MGRMWMTPVEMMCQTHLKSEYASLHSFAGLIIHKYKLDGYIKTNSLEVSAIQDRYIEVVAEILKREYPWPSKDLPAFDISDLPEEVLQYHVDRDASLEMLLFRCTECCKRYFER